jgi:hypothetical protein
MGTLLALATLYGLTGLIEECQKTVREILRISPEFSKKIFKEMIPSADQTMVEAIVEILGRAGLPE